jgi:integrase
MSRLALRYVKAFVDRQTGAVYHYVRRRGHPLVRLPGIPGSAEFMAAYQMALAGPALQIGIKRSKPGSVAAAVAAYLTSSNFTSKAPGTQNARRAILNRFRDQHGDLPITMPAKFINAVLGKKTPHAQRNWFKAIRGLFQFCVMEEMIEVDPTQSLKLPKAKSKRRRAWTEAEVEAYEAAHPIGTKARLALALGLYTVQRRSDVIRMGRQHIRNGMLAVRQQKTDTALSLPVRPELQAIIDATPGGHLTFLTTRGGKPYRGDNFDEQFRVWCDEAGLPLDCFFHGLRASGCTRLADAGASTHEIAAWSGHLTLKEVEYYTKGANQKRLAASGLAKLG